MTGFDRVMFYRFNEVGDGSVDAESVAPGLEPYLGLHYPASDIPQQARKLYLENRLRIIADARSKPARIVPTLRPDTGAPVDLSFAVGLRTGALWQLRLSRICRFYRGGYLATSPHAKRR